MNLNSTEIEMLRLLAEGKSTDEIADELHYSPSTIPSKMYKLYHKLGLDRERKEFKRILAINIYNRRYGMGIQKSNRRMEQEV